MKHQQTNDPLLILAGGEMILVRSLLGSLMLLAGLALSVSACGDGQQNDSDGGADRRLDQPEFPLFSRHIGTFQIP
jgi:hypothetical protein